MREILENSRKELILEEEEITMLRNYLDIHKLRLGTFDFSIEVGENLNL
ncbi:MAG: LytS/YehU family sensor histidine kinase [Cyclobacteriaceae bacterium]|jgi:LytS/YehU family sensor histidine kinase